MSTAVVVVIFTVIEGRLSVLLIERAADPCRGQWALPGGVLLEGESLDGAAVRKFAASGLQFLVSSSFSKSFSLYGERVGALSIVTASKEETARVLSQVKRIIRTNYSNPPTHGGAKVPRTRWRSFRRRTSARDWC